MNKTLPSTSTVLSGLVFTRKGEVSGGSRPGEQSQQHTIGILSLKEMGIFFPPKARRETDRLRLPICLVILSLSNALLLELPGTRARPHRKGTTIRVQTHHRLLAKQTKLTKIYTFPGSWPRV